MLYTPTLCSPITSSCTSDARRSLSQNPTTVRRSSRLNAKSMFLCNSMTITHLRHAVCSPSSARCPLQENVGLVGIETVLTTTTLTAHRTRWCRMMRVILRQRFHQRARAVRVQLKGVKTFEIGIIKSPSTACLSLDTPSTVTSFVSATGSSLVGVAARGVRLKGAISHSLSLSHTYFSTFGCGDVTGLDGVISGGTLMPIADWPLTST